jgi:segregation and condensation protein B
MEKNFIKIVGKKEVPGRPFMYGTTEKFLEHFGLKALVDLPSIDEIRQMVDSSVKKDDLMGTKKIVDVPPEDRRASPESQDGPQEGSQGGVTQEESATAADVATEASQTTEETTPSESEGNV